MFKISPVLCYCLFLLSVAAPAFAEQSNVDSIRLKFGVQIESAGDLTAEEFSDASTIIAEQLNRYSAAFIQKTTLQKIILYKTLRLSDAIPNGGSAVVGGLTVGHNILLSAGIYLDQEVRQAEDLAHGLKEDLVNPVLNAEYNKSVRAYRNALAENVVNTRHDLAANLDHELFHEIEDETLLSFVPMSRWNIAWQKTNDPVFMYAGSSGYGGAAYAQAGHTLHASTQAGFVSDYSMSDPMEDRAEIYRAMMNDSKNLAARVATDQILANKENLIREMLKDFCQQACEIPDQVK